MTPAQRQRREYASQTAWGLIGLLAASDADDPAVSSAVIHLVERQQSDAVGEKNLRHGSSVRVLPKYHCTGIFSSVRAWRIPQYEHRGRPKFCSGAVADPRN